MIYNVLTLLSGKDSSSKQLHSIFRSLSKFEKNHDFLPEFIFNIDETMVDVISNPEKVILFKDDTNPVITEPKKLKHMTLLLAYHVKVNHYDLLLFYH